tara:strand:- start:227 stop:1177 length:951 start_codon:yes stop_codon:yes gene_type:complete
MEHKKQLNTFHLFAGAGGGILADILLGHNPIGACEIEKYPRDVLFARQRDGNLPNFPIWDDVCTLDGRPWRGSVDVLCGGFPCQDISAAGKGAGITGERSGLWKEYARLISEMRPKFVFAENSPLLRTRGLGVVIEDLAALGYNARWGIIGAGAVGAPHKRDRMWVLAYRCELANSDLHSSSIKKCGVVGEEGESKGSNWEEDVASGHITGASPDQRKEAVLGLAQIPCESKSDLAYTDSSQREGAGQSIGSYPEHADSMSSSAWWRQDPAEIPQLGVGRVAHGLANRVDRLKAIGNGQVPQCAAMAFNILSEGLT